MPDATTEIICIIDRSGSMHSIARDAIGGFNSFLAAQKNEPGAARLTLVLFDNEYLLVHKAVDLDEVPPLTEHTYVPRGTTAMLDAIGRTIDDARARFEQMHTDERPAGVIVAILTDGLENASRKYARDRVFQMIEQCRAMDWRFTYLSANQDAIEAGGNLALDPDDCTNFTASPLGIHNAFSKICSDVVLERSRHR